FVPQSRPRLFIVAVKRDYNLPKALITQLPSDLWHPTALCRTYNQLPKYLQEAWIWWHLPKPEPRKLLLINLIEENPDSVSWHTATETQRLLDLMMPLHKEKVEKAKKQNTRIVGTIYRRIRINDNGLKTQCAEVRFDQVSGCLRTGSGGSSRQFIMVVEGDQVRSRLLSTREAARLMGVPDSYKLPQGYNEAYHLMGDGLVVPAVSWLEKHLLSPLAAISLGFPNKTGLADADVAYAIPAHDIQYRLLERALSK
ncbi:MAG: DNA cytosine methyltransferase, partial [Chloroflexi bacterium]|nr:DNA cytosine methyltransferase [Chloroflexota bacterium]